MLDELWSGVFIELIGITLQPETLKEWTWSLHIWSKIEGDLLKFGDQDSHFELFNSVKGNVAPSAVNVDSALEI